MAIDVYSRAVASCTAVIGLSEALRELQSCDWLKITGTHVTASRWKSQERLRAEFIDTGVMPSSFHECAVRVRRGKSESLEALLIRAGALVKAGYVPPVRTPVVEQTDRCACSSREGLRWNRQLETHLCQKCERAWDTASQHHDLAPRGVTRQ